MKLRQTQKLSSTGRKRPKKGFALIATLTLMMLLAMLAVTLMATAASQNRIALQTMLQAEARQQALVGLDAAIGELQVELGPDQRVSASSGILTENESANAPKIPNRSTKYAITMHLAPAGIPEVILISAHISGADTIKYSDLGLKNS